MLLVQPGEEYIEISHHSTQTESHLQDKENVAIIAVQMCSMRYSGSHLQDKENVAIIVVQMCSVRYSGSLLFSAASMKEVNVSCRSPLLSIVIYV